MGGTLRLVSVDTQPSTQEGAVPGLSIQEAAAELGISVNTVRRQVKAGRIRAEKVTTPSGYVYRVFPSLDTQPSTQASTRRVPEVDTQPSTQRVPVMLPDLARAEAMASYNRALIEPLVAELGEARRQVAEQAELIGELRARLAALEAPKAEPADVEPAAAPEAAPEPATRLWWRRAWRRMQV
jgi:excisionase family DNA binding protein